MEINIWQTLITIINCIIICCLPLMLVYHYKKIHIFEPRSYSRYMEVFGVIIYGSAIMAEFPALLSRWLTFYGYKLVLPEIIYSITSWDRSAHGWFYVMLFIYSWSNTNNRLPTTVQRIIDQNNS